MAIPGQTSKVSHNGIPALGESIEKRGLAHIGSTHQGQNWFHCVFNFTFGVGSL
jgi:hypothetical protein